MDLVIINNASYIKFNKNYYISKTTGQFIANYQRISNNKILLLQFEENGNIKNGISDYHVNEDIKLSTVPFFKV